MANTKNYGLHIIDKKTEVLSPDRINENMVKVDDQMKVSADQIKNLEDQINNIDVSGDVEQVVNRRLNPDTSKPLSTLISGWVDVSKTAILNTIATLTNHVTACRDNTNNHITSQHTATNNTVNSARDNVNSTVNAARDNVNSTVNAARDNIKNHISNTGNKARSKVYKPTWKGDATSYLLNITSPKGGMIRLGGGFYNSGYISVWVDGIQIINNEQPSEAWQIYFNNSSGYSHSEFYYTSSIIVQHVGRPSYTASGTAYIVVHENI